MSWLWSCLTALPFRRCRNCGTVVIAAHIGKSRRLVLAHVKECEF